MPREKLFVLPVAPVVLSETPILSVVSLLLGRLKSLFSLAIKTIYITDKGEWLGYSLEALGVDGSSLLTASQRCDGLNSSYA